MYSPQHLLPVYTPLAPTLVSGQGAWLQDSAGKSYLDFAAGVAVCVVGHSHPQLVDALQRQSQRLWHVSNWWQNQPSQELAAQLCARSFADKVFFSNSGAEANEAAFKLARKYQRDLGHANKHVIASCIGGFHGRTLFTASVGGKYHEPFAPLPGEPRQFAFNDCAALDAALDEHCCALVIEPVQGEGGVNIASAEFLHAARAACDRHGALLIFDEIQSGMGRCGYLFAHQEHGVEPDIMTLAKGLGGGFPIGATLCRAGLEQSLAPGWHGSTFGGNPLATAVGQQVLQLVDDQLLAQVRGHSQRLIQGLQQLNARFRFFSSLRAAGLLLGMDLTDGFNALELQRACFEQGLLVLPAGGGTVLRLAPPLIVNAEEVDLAIARLEQALRHA